MAHRYDPQKTVFLIRELGSTSLDTSLARIGIDQAARFRLKQKMVMMQVYITDLPAVLANVIKQSALSKGGEAAIRRECLTDLECFTDILLAMNRKQLMQFLEDLQHQPFGLDELARDLERTLEQFERPRRITFRDRQIELDQRSLVMGILNITPDSFSDGGRYLQPEAAVRHAEKLIAEGVDILDIGGESTRPGSQGISAEEEMRRVIPVLQAIRTLDREILISIDTSKAAVAEAAVKAGADMINDISAGTFDAEMLTVMARCRVPVVLMHTTDRPDHMQEHTEYPYLMADIYRFLKYRIEAAVKAGVAPERIMVDPGIGFGKTYEHNLEIINQLQVFKGLGCPLMIGVSQKRFIGEVLKKEVHERVFGSAAAVALSLRNGANILRVHQAKEMIDVIRMSEAIRKEMIHA